MLKYKFWSKHGCWSTAWRDVTWETNTGNSANKENLEAEIRLNRLDNTNSKIVWGYKLIGCFMEDYDEGTLDGSTPDAQQPTITLSFDYFKDAEKGTFT